MAHMEFTLRPAAAGDEEFLAQLYGDVRYLEFAILALPPEAFATLMQMQYRAQRLGYQNSYPNAQHSIIWVGETRVGRILVDYAATSVLLVDIALLTAARNHGIGTAILQALQAEAHKQNLPLRLHVRFGNRALQLYQRLGFRQTGETATHLEMELPPAS